MSNKVLITNSQKAVKVPSGLRILIRRACNAVLEYEHFDRPAEISVSFVFYQLIQFARKSRAGQLVKGIALLILFYGFAVLLDLRTVTWVLNNVVTVAFTAAVFIFRP